MLWAIIRSRQPVTIDRGNDGNGADEKSLGVAPFKARRVGSSRNFRLKRTLRRSLLFRYDCSAPPTPARPNASETVARQDRGRETRPARARAQRAGAGPPCLRSRRGGRAAAALRRAR